MKVISLVPSWTETLLEAGVDVVGRTRFCIHPGSAVGGIPVVGGTKDVDWTRVSTLKADIVVMDREENTKEMADSCPLPFLATHVESISDIGENLQLLSHRLESPSLLSVSREWEELEPYGGVGSSFENLPGLIRWVRKPESSPKAIDKVLYLIWKDPWMSVGPDTFIRSVLEYIGLGEKLCDFPDKYPKIDLDDFDPSSTLLLYSSEPYPFEKKIDQISSLPFAGAIVDGEGYSWFGTRSLRFLQSLSV